MPHPGSASFCPQCKGELRSEERDGRQRPVCSQCGYVVYINPTPCVAAVLVRDGRVLLVERGVEPGKGRWCLPAGFMEWGETPEESVAREVTEETGLHCRPQSLLSVYSEIIEIHGHIVLLAYRVNEDGGALQAGDDATDARFFDPRELPPLAFRVHHQIIRQFVDTHHEESAH